MDFDSLRWVPPTQPFILSILLILSDAVSNDTAVELDRMYRIYRMRNAGLGHPLCSLSVLLFKRFHSALPGKAGSRKLPVPCSSSWSPRF